MSKKPAYKPVVYPLKLQPAATAVPAAKPEAVEPDIVTPEATPETASEQAPVAGLSFDSSVPDRDRFRSTSGAASRPVEVLKPVYEPVEAPVPAPVPAPAPAPEAAAATPANTPVTIAVNISMPKLSLPKPKLPKIKLPKLSLKRLGKWPLIAGGIAALLLISVLLFQHFRHITPQAAAAFVNGQSVSTGSASALSGPTFKPVVPSSKIAQSGFDGSKDSYSFTAYLDGTILTVSEQPLPSNFSSARQAISTVARSIGANTLVPTSGDSAYMATDSKSKTQTIVYSKNDLLIFLQSPFSHDVKLWGLFIDSLK